MSARSNLIEAARALASREVSDAGERRTFIREARDTLAVLASHLENADRAEDREAWLARPGIGSLVWFGGGDARSVRVIVAIPRPDGVDATIADTLDEAIMQHKLKRVTTVPAADFNRNPILALARALLPEVAPVPRIVIPGGEP